MTLENDMSSISRMLEASEWLRDKVREEDVRVVEIVVLYTDGTVEVKSSEQTDQQLSTLLLTDGLQALIAPDQEDS